MSDSSGATASKAFGWRVFEQPLDRYGGLVKSPCPNGAQVHFYTQRVGKRWRFCTLAGNAFWMNGLFGIVL